MRERERERESARERVQEIEGNSVSANKRLGLREGGSVKERG